MVRRLRDIILARPSARGPAAVLVQCLLILLWHALFLAICVAVHNLVIADASRFWIAMRVVQSVGVPEGHVSLLGTLREYPETAYWSAVLFALEGAIAYLLFRVFVPSAPNVPERFLRSWWRTCLWATVLAPPAAVLGALLPPNYLLNWIVPVPLLAGLVIGPAITARLDRAPGLRRSRWRPVCPECGYNLRRAMGACCPECGDAFPTRSRVFRRWATRRLNWDRKQRGSTSVAYARSLLTILIRPCRAAGGAVMPDRCGRAVRWALFHVGLAALIGLMFGSDMFFTNWVFRRFGLPSWVSREVMLLSDPPAMRVAAWAIQSYAAWFLALGVIPLIGVVLSGLAPGRRWVARMGAVKWSLYCSAALPFMIAAWGGLKLGRLTWSATSPLSVLAYGNAEVPFSAVVPAVLYALWWSRGVSVNPYLRRRGLAVLLLNAYLFMVIWLVLTQLIWAPRSLVELL